MPFLTPPQLVNEDTITVSFLIPDSPDWSSLVRGALTNLADDTQWEKLGIDVKDAVRIGQNILDSYNGIEP